MDAYKIELWPGYKTSIRQHEQEVLLCCEIDHKVMRQETVYDILNRLYKSNTQNYKEEFFRQIVGITVLTSYNNKTYRIDDIDWTLSPRSTFSMKNEQLSYTNYYLEVILYFIINLLKI